MAPSCTSLIERKKCGTVDCSQIESKTKVVHKLKSKTFYFDPFLSQLVLKRSQKSISKVDKNFLHEKGHTGISLPCHSGQCVLES